MLVLGLVAAACGEEERRPIRVTPTSTADPGVRVLVDNCPGPSSLALLVRDEVLWQIEAPPEAAASLEAEDEIDDDPDTGGAESIEPAVESDPDPALREFLVGETPPGWSEATALESSLTTGIRYTIATEPDEQSIDFSLPDLRPGLLFDGEGVDQFNDDLIRSACSEPADVGGFARDLMVLLGLWITSAALVMVALILFLFVITQRFSRIRSIQRRAGKDAVAGSS